MASKKFFNNVEIKSDIILNNETPNTVPVVDATGKVKSSAVTSTELGHISGVTSAVQTQLDAKIPSSEKGAANGVATLDAGGKIPTGQLPSYVDDVLEYVNLAGFPATGETGKLYVALDTNKTYRWSGTVYVEISPSEVNSVFGRTGAVTAASGDYTASQVTNTPAGTIVATDVQTAINELDSDVQTVQSNLNTHTGATTGAHAATAISYSNGTSGLTAVNTQAAIDELSERPKGSAGDIDETSFAITNNQTLAADVTGLIFSNAVVRSFEALLSIQIDATSDLYETFKLHGIQRGTDWQMSVEGVGDNSGLAFSITTAGQVQYTSTNVAGFLSGTLKFRAISTSV